MRTAKGLSTRVMAREAGMAHMTYVSYEQGKAIPLPPKRPGLARALGISDKALEDVIEEDQYEIFLRARQMSDAGRVAVREFLRKVRAMEQAEGEKGREQAGEG